MSTIFLDNTQFISILDTGPGISPDDIDYIFDPFFTKNPKGFGLGLSISHTIIEEHDGRIIAESNPGSGACFRIFLPVTGGEFENVECGI